MGQSIKGTRILRSSILMAELKVTKMKRTPQLPTAITSNAQTPEHCMTRLKKMKLYTNLTTVKVEKMRSHNAVLMNQS